MQAFANVFMDNLSFSDPHLHKKYFKKYLLKTYPKKKSNRTKRNFPKHGGCAFQQFREFANFHIPRYENMLKGCSDMFLYLSKCFGDNCEDFGSKC